MKKTSGPAVGSDPGRLVASQPQRLKRSVLGPIDIAAATMANIAPAMSFYFGFGFLALTAGIASPLTIIAAAIVIAFLGNTLAQFSRAHPSTGSFITFIGKAFGPTSAIATAVLLITGYIIAIVSVIVISGGFTAIFLNHYIHQVPTSIWPVFVVIFVTFGAFLMVRGIHISTRWAGVFFAFEFVVLIVVSVITLIHHANHLTLHPFMPHYLSSGFKGLGLGFPLAVYLFIGWENSATLAEETDNPRRNVPRALYTSIAIMMFSYLLFSYATVEGFSEKVSTLSSATIPFITVANGVLGALAFFAYLAGVTSAVGCVIAAVNSQSRLLFNAGREGLLPAWVGRVYAKRQTPVNALLTFTGIGFVLVFAWAYGQHVDPVTLFAEASTLGSIMVVVVYFVANLALPVYYHRHRPDEFSFGKHLVIPLVGAAVIAFPIYELVKPGQAYPYNWFPYISLAVIVVAVLYAVILNARDKTLVNRVGSLVADDVADGKFTQFLEEDEDLIHRLQRIVTCLNQDVDVKRAVQESLLLIAEPLQMDSVAVFAVRGDEVAPLLAVHGETQWRQSSFPALSLVDPLVAAAMKQPQVADVSQAGQIPEALLAVACRRFGALVFAPAAAGPDVAAFLVLSRRQREPLSGQQTEFVATVAQALGLVLHNRALTAAAQHSATVLQTAYAVARAITHSLDLERTYGQIAVNAARVAPGSSCLLFELERASGDLLVVASSDPESAPLRGTRARLQVDSTEALQRKTFSGFALQTVAAHERIEVGLASKFSLGSRADARLASALTVDSSLVVPLVVQDELVGSLLIYATRRRRKYSALEIAELQSVAEQAAIAIHNALLYRNLEESQARVEALVGRLTQIREQERQALARVVHDDIVQSIIGAIYRLDDFRDTVAVAHVKEFDEAVAVLRRSVEDARSVIWELRPPALEGLGLSEALRALAERAGSQAQVRVRAAIAEIPDMGEAVTIGIYKIAREALLNSVHHAAAEQIQLRLAEVRSADRRAAQLLVEDDGVGFDSREPDRSGGHYGMVMMEEQATLIGGALTVASRQGRGTRVEVVVPLVR